MGSLAWLRPGVPCGDAPAQSTLILKIKSGTLFPHLMNTARSPCPPQTGQPTESAKIPVGRTDKSPDAEAELAPLAGCSFPRSQISTKRASDCSGCAQAEGVPEYRESAAVDFIDMLAPQVKRLFK